MNKNTQQQADKIRARLTVAGRVQGVFYRSSAREQAGRLGVTGRIANRPGGKVEAVLEGGREAVEQMIAWCRQGPPAAVVDNVHVSRRDFRGEYKDFQIEY